MKIDSVSPIQIVAGFVIALLANLAAHLVVHQVRKVARRRLSIRDYLNPDTASSQNQPRCIERKTA